MTISKKKLTFPNARGEQLAALLDCPDGVEPVAFALFAHCFTCSKNIITATRISAALADRGIAVLRFDFTGIGGSEGEFANTNFSSNIDDLVSASEYLEREYAAPTILIGHSLGGAAVIAAAPRLPEAKAVVTIAAPSDPSHMHHLLRNSVQEIKSEGRANVEIGGQEFTITSQFLEDVAEHKLEESLQNLDKALLIMHSSKDEMVEIEHAYHLFDIARCPKSFISLDRADHLLSNPSEAEYAAGIIAAWSSHYI